MLNLVLPIILISATIFVSSLLIGSCLRFMSLLKYSNSPCLKTDYEKVIPALRF